VKHNTIISIVIAGTALVLTSCAQLSPYLAPPAPQKSMQQQTAGPAEQDENWVPPQPYPGRIGTRSAKKVPLPDEKPKPSDDSDSQIASLMDESTQKTQTAALLPQDIVGMNEARVASTLGPPFARSENPPARVWQYRGEDCILKVRFFLDLNDQSFRALSVDAAKTDGEKDVPERCFAQVMAARR
jgi:hypothetical protein